MEEDMMDMQVQPVMQPEQPMMQGTPAPQKMSWSNATRFRPDIRI